ncbi:MAG: DNA polymerase III subunit delta' [Acidobacteria bacterium]|nr:DNA polymerase III subunit delta' [Acidobacteriota bacterium]
MFTQLIGNEGNKELLKRLLAEGRLPPSFLFAGPEGVGKRQFAVEVAKAVVCTNSVNGEACGECSACRRCEVFQQAKEDDKDAHKLIQWSAHRDVGMVVPYNRHILVDAIRDLEKEANFRPFEAAARVFIVDDADRMNDAAANAILKTLEEPPAASYIFLLTSRPDSMLATIRSRCQMIRFSPIQTNAIEEFLIRENGYSADEARLAAAVSYGSIGRALSIKPAEYRERTELMIAVIRSIVRIGDAAALMNISKELTEAKEKEHFEENLDILESLIHDVWTLSVGAGAERVVHSEYAAELVQVAKMRPSSTFAGWIDAIEELRRSLDVNINKKVATDALFVTMANG